MFVTYQTLIKTRNVHSSDFVVAVQISVYLAYLLICLEYMLAIQSGMISHLLVHNSANVVNSVRVYTEAACAVNNYLRIGITC